MYLACTNSYAPMDFLTLVTQDLIRRFGIDNLQSLTVVFPMHRAGLFMRECLQREVLARSSKPILAPQMQTIDDLIASLSGLHAEDEILSVCRLYDIYKRHTGSDMTLDIFYGWGRQLLQDFSSVDMSLADADSLFSNAVAAQQLDQIELSNELKERLLSLFGNNEHEADDEAYRARFQQLWDALPAIWSEFRQLQMEDRVGSSGARLRWLIEHWDEVLPRLQGRQFAFVGFNYLLRSEKQLLQLLRGQSLFYWDYDPDFQTNPDAYRFIRKHIEDGLTNALPAEQEASSGPKPIQIISTSGAHVQAQYVHDWLLNCKGKTGIIIADEAQLEAVIYALPDTVSEHVNITKGYPLKNTKIFTDIVTWLTDHHHDKLPSEADYTGVLARLLEYCLPLPTAKDAEQDEEPQPMSWQELLTAESQFQARLVIERFRHLIRMGRLIQIDSLKTLRNLLRRHLETASLPFHGEPVTDIQVIGVLETRLLDFDNLLILNAEEGVVPRVVADHSFIPYYLRKYYAIETPDESAAAYAYNFFRLLRRAKNITMLFSEAATAMGRKTMSRFVMQILTSPEYAVTKARIGQSMTCVQPTYSLLDPARPSLASIWKDKRYAQLSASAISTYLNCKRRFYLQYILMLTPPETISPLLQANEMGSLIHGTIRAAYSRIASVLPATIPAEQIRDFLASDEHQEQALDWAYQDMNTTYERHTGIANRYNKEEHKAENVVVRANVRKVLENDAQLEDWQLLEVEKEHRVSIPVIMEDGNILPVKVGGIIDRLDCVMRNGRKVVRVLDYKTGAYNAKKMIAPKIETVFAQETDDYKYILQTLIYSLAVASDQTLEEPYKSLPLMPGLLFTRMDVSRFDSSLKVEEETITDFGRQIQDAFRPMLQELVQEICVTKDFPQCSEEHCGKSRCPFMTLCNPLLLR